jgi:hypothetical protein
MNPGYSPHREFFRDGRHATVIITLGAAALSIVATVACIYIFMTAGRAQLPRPLVSTILTPSPLAAVVVPSLESSPPEPVATANLTESSLTVSSSISALSANIQTPPPTATPAPQVVPQTAPQVVTQADAGDKPGKGGQGSFGNGGAAIFSSGDSDQSEEKHGGGKDQPAKKGQKIRDADQKKRDSKKD